ncbi:hypothetical protein AB6802_14790 [Mesorhizobium sp. RCC_202]
MPVDYFADMAVAPRLMPKLLEVEALPMPQERSNLNPAGSELL